MKKKNIKKLNEVKVGDTLYCIAYGINNKAVSIVEVTAKEIITDGPHIDRKIYSKEAIVINEKMPNSPEAEGEYVIDQYYRGDECMTHSDDIYTTFLEAVKYAQKEIKERWELYDKKEKEYSKKKWDVYNSNFALIDQLTKVIEKEKI